MAHLTNNSDFQGWNRIQSRLLDVIGKEVKNLKAIYFIPEEQRDVNGIKEQTVSWFNVPCWWSMVAVTTDGNRILITTSDLALICNSRGIRKFKFNLIRSYIERFEEFEGSMRLLDIPALRPSLGWFWYIPEQYTKH